ncbi:MAG: trigger factor, partial [bacterium]|nr:trigger factor [bacterium]
QKILPKSQMEIEFELTTEELQKHIEHALSHFKEHMKIDGFRPGQVPLKIIEEKVGQDALLMEAGELAVKEVYPKYILENGLEPVGQPEVQIMKIAKGNPFLFKAKITVLPEIELPDYKEVASRIQGKKISVSDQEVEDALNYLQKTRAKFTLKNEAAGKKDFVEIEYQSKDIDNNKQLADRFILGEGGFMKGFEENIEGTKAGEEKEFTVKFPKDTARKDLAGKDVNFKVKIKSVQKMELPEINDEFAKTLGEFQNLPAFKKNIKEGITLEKNETEKQRKRGEILDEIRQSVEEKKNFEIPEILVNFEKDRLLNDLKQQISQNIKITFEEYLATIKQTEEGLKENFSKEAEKRLKNFLVLREVGKREKIEVSEKEIEEEMKKSVKNNKIDNEQLKEYTKGAIYNEKVFQFLEKFSH